MKKIILFLTLVLSTLTINVNAETLTDYFVDNTSQSEYGTYVYAPDGRSEWILKNDVNAWMNVGWYTYPVMYMYAPDGRCEVVPISDMTAWLNVGWYSAPVQYMYAPDGRCEVVPASDVAAWINVGWYTFPVTIMYADDGRTAVVPKSDVAAWINVGWYAMPINKKIVIGGIGPLTGGAAIYGNAVKNGAQLAVDEINSAGGVNGINFELNFKDDEYDAERAYNAYKALKNEGAKIILGAVTSVSCNAVADCTARDNMFQITPTAGMIDSVQNANVFRECLSDFNQGAASAQYIAEHNIAKRVAVIYNTSDVYSRGIYDRFSAEAARRGMEITATETFSKNSSTDFSEQLRRINASGAELLFLPVYYQEAAQIITRAKSLGYSFKYFGCDGLDGIIDYLGDNVSIANGVMILTPFAADMLYDKISRFVAAYKAKFNNEKPHQFAALAYDAVYTIKAAMENAQISNANISVSELCDKIKASMTQITFKGVTGTTTWNASGEPVKEPRAVYIENGLYKAMQ